MKSEVTLILASVADGVPIYTLQLRYWRAIHAEFMTHRAFSRNASSSRAIPVDKMLKVVRESPAGPQHWGLNQKGMQAEVECADLVAIPDLLQGAFFEWAWKAKIEQYNVKVTTRENAWAFAAHLAASMSSAFSEAGYHKQISNRITEPFQMINVVVTATEWENFFALRNHPAAMPEFQELARSIRAALAGAVPQELQPGEWHIPYINPEDQTLSLRERLVLSTARCASVSYKTVDGLDMTLEKAIQVYEKLVGSDPKHSSPAEHQAKAFDSSEDPWRGSNLRFPWIQHRKMLEVGDAIEEA